MIHEDIKNLIDSQIASQTVKPTEDDIIPYSCLFSTDKDGVLSYKSGKDACMPRVETLYSILNLLNLPKNISFLFLTHDYTDPDHYENKSNFSLCFGKLQSQPFITIPNWSLLSGVVDNLLLEVRNGDHDLSKKLYASFFVGGPNCSCAGTRIKYATSGIDPSKHFCVISNNKIITVADQLQTVFLINLDGHSLCYDRLYWQMSSNSVPVYIERNMDIVQIHDHFIKPNIHYIPSSVSDWPETFENLRSDMNHLQFIAKSGQNFIHEHFKESPKKSSVEILEYTIHQIAQAQLDIL